jgi:hypothetical protein
MEKSSAVDRKRNIVYGEVLAVLSSSRGIWENVSKSAIKS